MKASLLLALSMIMAWQSLAAARCPATTSDDPLFGAWMPGWYGTEALAVRLSSPARWSTTRPGNLIGEKLSWRSAGFGIGTESDLKVAVRSLDGAPVTGSISPATSAYTPSVQPNHRLTDTEARALVDEALQSPDGWSMLTGVDFPVPGCWSITASYLGQVLTFVVETVDGNTASPGN